MAKSGRREFTVGVAALVAIIVVVYLTVQIRGLPLLEGTYQVDVRFKEVGQRTVIQFPRGMDITTGQTPSGSSMRRSRTNTSPSNTRTNRLPRQSLHVPSPCSSAR